VSADPTAPDRDPGLQPERTSLAWQRTAVAALLLSLVALGATAHPLAVPSGSAGEPAALPGLTVVATVVAVAAAVLAAVDAVVVVPAHVHGLVRHPASLQLASPYVRLLLMAATTVLLALAGGALAADSLVASVASSGA
jgi:uncharacterized membrane protein YidH (DUF202 family)